MKKINYNYGLLAVITLSLISIYIMSNKLIERNSELAAAAIIDNYLNNFKDNDNSYENPSNSNKISLEKTSTSVADSKIETMFDRYGNKTQTRCFDSHPRLRCVVLITKVGGEQQIFVYGQDGTVKSLTEDMYDKVLTETADEIANSAGIFVVKQAAVQPVFVQNNQSKTEIQTNQISVSPSSTQNQLSEPNTTDQADKTNKLNDKTFNKPSTESNKLTNLNSKPED